MKTLRFLGLTLMSILLGANLTSCSDEDDPTKNPEKLVGEWIEIHYREWGDYEGEKYDDEYSYDANKPEEDQTKVIFEEGEGKNEFRMLIYDYWDGKWDGPEIINIRLEGNKMIDLDDPNDDVVRTYELNGNILKIKEELRDENGYDIDEITFQKM